MHFDHLAWDKVLRANLLKVLLFASHTIPISLLIFRESDLKKLDFFYRIIFEDGLESKRGNFHGSIGKLIGKLANGNMGESN